MGSTPTRTVASSAAQSRRRLAAPGNPATGSTRAEPAKTSQFRARVLKTPQTVEEPWFVYIARCNDGSLYTGIALDVAQRIAAHNSGAARATREAAARSRCALTGAAAPRAPRCAWSCAVKRLARPEKETLLGGRRLAAFARRVAAGAPRPAPGALELTPARCAGNSRLRPAAHPRKPRTSPLTPSSFSARAMQRSQASRIARRWPRARAACASRGCPRVAERLRGPPSHSIRNSAKFSRDLGLTCPCSSRSCSAASCRLVRVHMIVKARDQLAHGLFTAQTRER